MEEKKFKVRLYLMDGGSVEYQTNDPVPRDIKPERAEIYAMEAQKYNEHISYINPEAIVLIERLDLSEAPHKHDKMPVVFR